MSVNLLLELHAFDAPAVVADVGLSVHLVVDTGGVQHLVTQQTEYSSVAANCSANDTVLDGVEMGMGLPNLPRYLRFSAKPDVFAELTEGVLNQLGVDLKRSGQAEAQFAIIVVTGFLRFTDYLS